MPLNKRVHEFCNFNAEWPFRQLRKRFRSSQNAALLQYRIPHHGSFVASVKFIENPERMYLIFKTKIIFPNKINSKVTWKIYCSCFFGFRHLPQNSVQHFGWRFHTILQPIESWCETKLYININDTICSDTPSYQYWGRTSNCKLWCELLYFFPLFFFCVCRREHFVQMAFDTFQFRLLSLLLLFSRWRVCTVIKL